MRIDGTSGKRAEVRVAAIGDQTRENCRVGAAGYGRAARRERQLMLLQAATIAAAIAAAAAAAAGCCCLDRRRRFFRTRPPAPAIEVLDDRVQCSVVDRILVRVLREEAEHVGARQWQIQVVDDTFELGEPTTRAVCAAKSDHERRGHASPSTPRSAEELGTVKA